MLWLRFIKACICLCCFFSTAPLPVQAEEFHLTLNGEKDYFYHLMKIVLEEADGDHELKIYRFPLEIPQSRLLRSLIDKSAPFNVTFTGHRKERQAALRQIDIPLTRGLFGYRVLVVPKKSEKKLAGITTFDDLIHRVSLGSGASWPDTKVLKAAGFRVETGSAVTLWSMLARSRFDAYPRSIYEATRELEDLNYQVNGVPLMINKKILLHYPFDLFFYVAADDKKRADIITQGLNRAYANGRFMENFQNDPKVRQALNLLSSHNWKLFNIANPLNSDRINALPQKYWHTLAAENPN